MWQALVALSLLACCSTAKPLHESLKDDIATVESLRRHVRESPTSEVATEVKDLLGDGQPSRKNRDAQTHMKNTSGKSDEGGFYKTYGSDADGEKGYLKETYSKGDQGYKTLDTFHKRDGDKYGFEKHITYGKGRANKKSSRHDDAGSHSGNDGDHEGAATIVDTHYTDDEGDHYNRGNEYSRYVEDGDGDHYSNDDSSHYVGNGPESSSYGHSESYSAGNGEDGSYETHSSYSVGNDGERGDESGHY